MIEALARAPEWDLVVAGTRTAAPYQQLADSLGVGEAVHWLGVVRDMPARVRARRRVRAALEL